MLYSIQAVRFSAALVVLVVHCFSYLQKSTAYYAEILLYITGLGNAGVHIFFVISGFIIVYSAKSEFGSVTSVVPFLLRRLLRIFPLFWILALINIPVRMAIGLPLPETTEDFFLAIFLYPGHSSQLIFVGWSLSFELFFYLTMGILICFSLVRAVKLMTGMMLGLALLGLLGIGKTVDGGFWTNSLLAEFVFGAWIAILAIRGFRIHAKLALAMLLIGIVLLLMGLLFDYTQYPRTLIWGVPSTLIVFGCVNLELSGGLPRWVAKCKTLGDASYALYLGHAVLIPPIVFLVVPEEPSSLLFTLGLGICLAIISITASVWIFRFVERPIIQWSRHKTSVRKQSVRESVTQSNA